MMRKFISLILFSFVLSFFACVEQKNTTTKDNKSHKRLKIVCTTGMIGDVVKNIVGDSAEVYTLMGAGVDPHLYKATQNDVEQLTEADIIFYNGLHLEGKMTDILKKMTVEKPVVALGDAIEKEKLRQVADNVFDPHIWMHVAYWKQTLPQIVETIVSEQPHLKNYLAQNLTAYSRQLDTLHHQIQNEIQQIPKNQRVLITSHDAFYYFGQAYAIEVRPLQGISTASEAGISDINELVKFIVERNIKAVFVESSISPQAIQAVLEGAKQKGANVRLGATLYSDAMGKEGTDEGTYIGMMRYNALQIKENLK